MREARAAARRLRQVRQKPKGSGKKAAWLKGSQGEDYERLHMATNPLSGRERNPDSVEAFSSPFDDEVAPPRVRPAWTPEKQVRSYDGKVQT